MPWFYCFPTADILVDELKEAYVRESRELWGSGEEDVE